MKLAFRCALVFSLAIVTHLSFGLSDGVRSEVASIYLDTELNSYPYIVLKEPNSMEGCHGNNSGYLVGSDISKAYATALAALRAGSEVKVYFQKNEGASGWSKCHIKAFYAY